MRTMDTNHPPALPMMEGDVEGSGGADLANGPLDGRTNRGSNPRPRRAPSMAHTTTPSMPHVLYGAKMVKNPHGHSLRGGGGVNSSLV